MSLVHQDLGIDEAASENKLSPLWPLPRRTKAKFEEIFSQFQNQRDSIIDRKAPSCYFCWRQIYGFGSFIAVEKGLARVMDPGIGQIRFHSMKISMKL